MSVFSITYYDKNNNTYSISPNMVSYRPMTPEMSSSGTYSGGDPKDVEIDGSVFKEILIPALELGVSVHLHRDKREMLTSRLSIRLEGKRSYSYILGKSILLQEFEKALVTILGK